MVTITLDAYTITAGDYKTAYTLALAQLTRDEEKDPPIERVRAWAEKEIARRNREERDAAVPDKIDYFDKLLQARDYLAAINARATIDPTNYPAICGEEAAARKLDAPSMAAQIIARADSARHAYDTADARAFKATIAVAAARTPDDILNALVETAGDELLA